MNLKNVLEKTAREMPHNTAFVLGSQRVSYREFDETSNRIAHALVETGIKKGDHVGILLGRTPEWVINCFGVLKAGAAAVLLDSRVKAPELEPQLRESHARALITEERFSPLVSSVMPAVPMLKHVLEVDSDAYRSLLAGSSSASPDVPIDGEDSAIIFYTLGVLGKNKGVLHTHSSFCSALDALVPRMDMRTEDVVLGLLPFNYLLGFGVVVLGPIVNGSTMVILPHFSSKNVLEITQQERATMLIGVPASFNALAVADEEILKAYDLSSLRTVLTAGAKSSAYLMEMLENRLNLRVMEIYGLTELIIVTMGGFHDRKVGTVGKPVAELRVLDRGGNEVPQGAVGEAVARAPFMMKEYYDSPELTAQAIQDGWFHTRDLVRMNEDGYVEYVEKMSSIIVPSGGVKILPEAVEEVLLHYPAIAETAYVGVVDEYRGQIPTAFVVLKDGQSATADEIRDFCRESVTDYKVPKQIRFVDTLPRTPSGQIDRKLLSTIKES
ncbi:MAG: class I adenylate-forming enzyme family protein [Dehalococcoidia bacterium]